MLPESKTQPPRKAQPWGIFVLIVALLIASEIHHTAHLKILAHQQFSSTPARLRKTVLIPVPTSTADSQLPFKIGEDSGILWDLNTGRLIWAYHPHLKGPYASTTKLMTIYLVLRQLPLNQVVSISPAAAATPGSDIKMAVGQRFTVQQLLYALMMRSANDSAVALAQAVSGHVATFVAQMNRQAQILGMTGTTYGDPDGLSVHSSGTAWDLSIIARLDMTNPLFRKIVRTKLTSLPGNPVVTNLNGLLYMDPTVIGVKSGWTTRSGFNLVFAATRPVNGHNITLLGVVMHGQQGFPPEYQDVEHILNWGFNEIKTSAPGKIKGR